MARTTGRKSKVVVFLALLTLLPIAAIATETDPLERVNRPIFWLNDKLDVYVLEPVARGWNRIAPDPVQKSVSNFFRNLEMPTNFVNNLLQWKPRRAAIDVTRFAFNTTVGIGGLFDPATDWGLLQSDEDFGQTLGAWSVPEGPFLMLPFLGPHNLRDGAGRLVDSTTAVYPVFVPGVVSVAGSAADTVNWRAQSLETIETLKEASVDWYVATRNAYRQQRRALVADGEVQPADEEEDLYFFDEEE